MPDTEQYKSISHWGMFKFPEEKPQPNLFAQFKRGNPYQHINIIIPGMKEDV